jgi:hypothetical protein
MKKKATKKLPPSAYSASKARKGKDIGKPGKNFAKIVKKEGGGKKGKRIAGAILREQRGGKKVKRGKK